MTNITIMLITFGVFVFISVAMAIGVILADKPLTGSCGGLNNLGLKDDCPICGDSDKKLKSSANDRANSQIFYDATTSKP